MGDKTSTDRTRVSTDRKIQSVQIGTMLESLVMPCQDYRADSDMSQKGPKPTVPGTNRDDD